LTSTQLSRRRLRYFVLLALDFREFKRSDGNLGGVPDVFVGCPTSRGHAS